MLNPQSLSLTPFYIYYSDALNGKHLTLQCLFDFSPVTAAKRNATLRSRSTHNGYNEVTRYHKGGRKSLLRLGVGRRRRGLGGGLLLLLLIVVF